MNLLNHLLYLSEADVARVGVSLDALREAVAAAFAAQARGEGAAAPKSVITLGPGHVFQAKPAIVRSSGYTCVKWFGLVPPGSTAGPSISSLILLSDIPSGMAVAIMGGYWITAKRTAAMTAIAAQKLARADSESIGFVGAGVQGHSHLEALRLVLPRLKRVTVCSRTEQSAQKLAGAARAAGLEAVTTRDPRAAVQGMDVVITTVPEGTEKLEFLDPDWVAPGAFVGAVDLARSWMRGKIPSFDLLATDEHEQTRVLTAAGRMTWAGPYAAELSELCSGAHPGRGDPRQRIMFNYSGHALADLAGAQLVYETARRRAIGTVLPR
ncbi:MAG: ornithine cyclodeaminase family protein [Betaproteobacteria bacterium]|nr:ornithine cyclodeaminase family protein [Betaproteobacteria bacterium]